MWGHGEVSRLRATARCLVKYLNLIDGRKTRKDEDQSDLEKLGMRMKEEKKTHSFDHPTHLYNSKACSTLGMQEGILLFFFFK